MYRRSMPRRQEDSSSRQCQCYRACRCLQRIKNACKSTHSTNTSVSLQHWGETAHSAQQGQVGRRAAGSSGQGSRVRLCTYTCPSVSRRRRQAWSAQGACARESARRARTSCLFIQYTPRAAQLSPTNFLKAEHLMTCANILCFLITPLLAHNPLHFYQAYFRFRFFFSQSAHEKMQNA
jgi:hypothetical protein